MITCRFEDGGEARLRHVVFDALIIKDNRLLMVKRSSAAPVEANKLALPGGFMDRDEDLFAGIKREVMEETGYQTQNIELFRIIHHPQRRNEDRQNVAFVFTCTPIDQVGEPDHEVTEIKWFPFDALPPKHKIAFDHAESIEIFKEHLEQSKTLPLI